MRLRAKLIAVLLDLGFLASVAAAYKGMRQLMVASGGYCASGGPFTIAAGHQCTTSETDYLLFGLLGVFLIGGCALAAASWAGWSSFTTGLIGWSVLFGALGANFVSLGFDPPRGSGAAGGWIVSGVVFWLMAIGGAVPVVGDVVGWVRRGGRPEPSPTPVVPLVRAAVNQDRA
jgi:hypothetical protein